MKEDGSINSGLIVALCVREFVIIKVGAKIASAKQRTKEMREKQIKFNSGLYVCVIKLLHKRFCSAYYVL